MGNLRLRGTALVGAVGRLTGSGVQFAIAATFTAFGVAGVATGLVCALLVQAAAVLLLGPDTSERSLEEIAAGAGIERDGMLLSSALPGRALGGND